MSSDDERTRVEYLDLLAATLTKHEKTLDSLIERLEKTLSALIRAGQQTTREAPATREDSPKVITYSTIEIPYNRPVEELTKILETLTSKSKKG